MQRLQIGAVTIDSIIERDGPWRTPQAMFPAWDAATEQRHLPGLPAGVIDPVSGKMIITYQTFVVRTPHHTILVDTCTGEHKGYPPPMDFPVQPWADGFAALGLTPEAVDYVFCTHLHIDHTGWNTSLRDGRWVPTFPRAKYIFHADEYAAWEASTAAGESRPGGGGDIFRMNCAPIVAAGQALLVRDDFALDDTVRLLPTPGHSPGHVCVEITSGGQQAIVTGDLMHHALQVREPDWSTIFCWDPIAAARSRRLVFERVADQPTLLLPVHFPAPTAGRIHAAADGFHYRFIRD
jgi:glyoxylase-like metal-dependent hydrolase (beta-lactamase superfamily II)